MTIDALIPVTDQTVNARDLHAFLGVKKKFADWIKERIERHGFDQGIDYEVYEDLSFPNSGSAKARPQKRLEYALTIRAAKHISMAENTPRAIEARDYFIDCERVAKEAISKTLVLPDFNDPVAAARAWADELEAKRLALAENEAMKPKAEAFDTFMTAEKGLNVRSVAKALRTEDGIKIGEKQLFSLLRSKKILMSNGTNEPYQRYVNQGFFMVRTGKADNDHVFTQTLVTAKGVEFIRKTLLDLGY